MKISMDKKYTTRDGKPVRILAVDLPNPAYPVGVAVGDSGALQSYTADGQWHIGGRCPQYDLVEAVPESVTYHYMEPSGYVSAGCRAKLSYWDVCAGDRILKLTIQGDKVTGEFVSQDVK